ncbi:hypothetical protein Agub_g6613 [Astrephomene gubernaculifera]|uniref:EF-hand domain-containing protein n=1 Tax=Astrephomene gubernaculifera TaxID=47775 RepID=A0AAD3DR77_9CHLO|nr:hypothetical protein Agub_g6613 [Astrephomene gubernaculifera]
MFKRSGGPSGSSPATLHTAAQPVGHIGISTAAANQGVPDSPLPPSTGAYPLGPQHRGIPSHVSPSRPQQVEHQSHTAVPGNNAGARFPNNPYPAPYQQQLMTGATPAGFQQQHDSPGSALQQQYSQRLQQQQPPHQQQRNPHGQSLATSPPQQPQPLVPLQPFLQHQQQQQQYPQPQAPRPNLQQQQRQPPLVPPALPQQPPFPAHPHRTPAMRQQHPHQDYQPHQQQQQWQQPQPIQPPSQQQQHQPLQPLQPLQHLRQLPPPPPQPPYQHHQQHPPAPLVHLTPLLPPPSPLPPPTATTTTTTNPSSPPPHHTGFTPSQHLSPPPPPPPPPSAPSASPLLREVVSEGRLYILDTSSQLVYRDSAEAGLLERVGKWVQGSIVFLPLLRETSFFSSLRSFLSRRQLGLAELFAALDADLDGGLGPGELRALLAHVVPGAAPSEAALLMALLDWDDDGYVSLGDLLDADELAEEVAEARGEGADSPWARVLQDTSYILHMQRNHAATVFQTLALEAAAAAALAASDAGCGGVGGAALLPSGGEAGGGGGGYAAGGALSSSPAAGPSPTLLLEPAQLFRFLRIMRPELGPGEARYVLDHLLQGPGDSRRSLAQVLHMLHLADVAYTSDRQQQQLDRQQGASSGATTSGDATTGAAATAAAEAELNNGSSGSNTSHRRRPAGGAQGLMTRQKQKQQQRPPPLGPSRLRRQGGNPRDSVPRFFYHLGYYLRSCRLGLRELLERFDSDGDGGLDPLDVRRLAAEVLQQQQAATAAAGGAAEGGLLGSAAIVYIRAALSSSSAALVTLEDLTRAVEVHNAEVSAGRQDAAAAAAGLPPSSPMAALYLSQPAMPAASSASTAATAPGGAEGSVRQRPQQQQQYPAADVLKWMTDYMARRKVPLASLLAQFDRDGDGALSPPEAARLLRFLAAGRLGQRQRELDTALARFRADADVDRDGLLSYNDLRLAIMARRDSLARSNLATRGSPGTNAAAAAVSAAAAAQAAATAAVLLGPMEPAPPATMRRQQYGNPDVSGNANTLPQVAPAAAAAAAAAAAVHKAQTDRSPSPPSGRRRVVHFATPSSGASPAATAPAALVAGLTPGTAAAEYDITPFTPARPTDPRDPFTLAFAAQHPSASALPYSTVAVFPSQPPPPPHPGLADGDGVLAGLGPNGGPMGHFGDGSTGGGGVGGYGGAMTMEDLPLEEVPELDVTLRAVEYLGNRLLVDPVCGLAFLPLPRGQQPQLQQPSQPPEEAEEELHLLGRLLPNGTLERVETPLAARLFAALDARLRYTQCRLEDLWTACVAGDGGNINTTTSRLTQQQQQQQYPQYQQQQLPAPPPPRADAVGLARFLRPLLPELTEPQLTYLRLLFDLDGDGRVAPDDLVMAFEEIGSMTDTPANKLHAQAYKLLARVAGVVLGDYEESYRVFERYSRLAAAGTQAGGAAAAAGAGAGAGPRYDTARQKQQQPQRQAELTLPELARFISHLTLHQATPEDLGALVVYLNTKLAAADGAAGPSARPVPGQPYGNNQPSYDNKPPGQLPPSRFDWPFIVGVLRGVEVSLPVERRRRTTTSPRSHGGGGGGAVSGSSRGTREGQSPLPHVTTAMSPAPPMEAPSVTMPTAKYDGLGGGPYAVQGPRMDGMAGAMAMPPGWPAVQTTQGGGGGAAAAASGAYEVQEEEEPGVEEAEMGGPWDMMGLLARPAPLRPAALTLPPAPHPDRRLVDLRFHVHTDGRTFLLDDVTGLLYNASPYILAAAAAAAEAAAGATASQQPQQRPLLLLPYPELAGKLQHPDNRLLPAQSGSGVALVCTALGRLAAEEQRVGALFRILDRDGGGLTHGSLQQLIAGTASLTAAEIAFARALLDRSGSGRVTWADIAEAAQVVRYTTTTTAAAAAAAPSGGRGGRSGLAPPVTLTLSRGEARALDVLHRAAQAVHREGRLLWLLVQKAGAMGTGQLDHSTAASMLRELLSPYLLPYESAIVVSYIAMMTPDKDGNISADELLQLLRVLPMRLRLPYTDAAAAVQHAAGELVAVGREVVFAAGFGGPVSANGTLPPIHPSVHGGVGGGGGGAAAAGLSYQRQFRYPTGPANAQSEPLYGPIDGAQPYDPNLPYDDPGWSEELYGREASGAAGPRRASPPRQHASNATTVSPGRSMGQPGGRTRRPSPSHGPGSRQFAAAADQQHEQEVAGMYGIGGGGTVESGLYDDDYPELYGAVAPQASPTLKKSPPPALPPPPPPRQSPSPPRQQPRGPSRFAPPADVRGYDGRDAGRDPYLLDARAVAEAEETGFGLDKIRGTRPTAPLPRRMEDEPAGTEGGYGLMSDLQPAPAREPDSLMRRRRLEDDRGFDIQPPPLLPDRRPSPPRGLRGDGGGAASESGGGGFNPYDLDESVTHEDRPAALLSSPAVGGGRPAEVLSFLDQDGISSHHTAASGSSGGGAAAAGSMYDGPYGLSDPRHEEGHVDDDDMVMAGSVPPSRPTTAATLLSRSSAADMPRLASPLLDPPPFADLPPQPSPSPPELLQSQSSQSQSQSRPGSARPPTASRLSSASYGPGGGVGGSGGYGDVGYEPYSEEADSPAASRTSQHLRRSGMGGVPVAADASASGPALFTSFGDALRDNPSSGPAAVAAAAAASAGRRSSGGSQQEYGLGAETSEDGGVGLLLPPPSFRPAASLVAKSRLSKSSGRSPLMQRDDGEELGDRAAPASAGDDDDAYDPYEDNGGGGGGSQQASSTPRQVGGAASANTGAVGNPGGGGSGILNASIRSQMSPTDRLAGSRRGWHPAFVRPGC